MSKALGRFLYVLFSFSFSLELGSDLLSHKLVRARRIRGFPRMRISIMSGSKLSIFHLQYWGTGYREDQLGPCCTKGKFLVLTPGGVIPNWLK